MTCFKFAELLNGSKPKLIKIYERITKKNYNKHTKIQMTLEIRDVQLNKIIEHKNLFREHMILKNFDDKQIR